MPWYVAWQNAFDQGGESTGTFPARQPRNPFGGPTRIGDGPVPCHRNTILSHKPRPKITPLGSVDSSRTSNSTCVSKSTTRIIIHSISVPDNGQFPVISPHSTGIMSGTDVRGEEINEANGATRFNKNWMRPCTLRTLRCIVPGEGEDHLVVRVLIDRQTQPTEIRNDSSSDRSSRTNKAWSNMLPNHDTDSGWEKPNVSARALQILQKLGAGVRSRDERQ